MPLMLDAGSLAALALAGLMAVMLGLKLRARLVLSRAKHRSLAGHSRQRLAYSASTRSAASGLSCRM